LLAELTRWNSRVNLTAIRDPDDMIIGHLLDSLSARPHLRGSDILDVGTGAGFPGLPLAIAEPGRQFVVVDGNNKKVAFVEHVSGLLGLSNVTAIKARTENFAPGKRFVFVALKGRYPAEELEEVPEPWNYRVIELKVPGLAAGSRHAVLMSRK
jgi:16S rRNA (guanine527-N7)-methyltransferase